MSKIILTTLTQKTLLKNKLPIWIMRQAGRYLPEYRNVRKDFRNFIDFCLTPQAAAEVTIQPLKRFALDAAIIFSDILILPYALGMKVEFLEGEGPKLGRIENTDDIAKYTNINYDVFNTVGSALKLVKSELDSYYPNKTLIGFAGAPFTIASYMIEGGGSKNFERTLTFSVKYPVDFKRLLTNIVDATIEYLKIQIESGAEVIKLFDSWAGIVPYNNFNEYVVEPITQIIDKVKEIYPNIPFIVFARNSGQKQIAFNHKTNIDALAIDQYTDLNWAFENLKTHGSQAVLQGNFDNYLLAHGSYDQIEKAANNILQMANGKSLIFNLGHGILPSTPIENVTHLINYITNFNNEQNSSEK